MRSFVAMTARATDREQSRIIDTITRSCFSTGWGSKGNRCANVWPDSNSSLSQLCIELRKSWNGFVSRWSCDRFWADLLIQQAKEDSHSCYEGEEGEESVVHQLIKFDVFNSLFPQKSKPLEFGDEIEVVREDNVFSRALNLPRVLDRPQGLNRHLVNPHITYEWKKTIPELLDPNCGDNDSTCWCFFRASPVCVFFDKNC